MIMKTKPPSLVGKTIIPEKTKQPARKDFVREANKHKPLEEINQSQGTAQINYPWNESQVRNDVTRLFNLRLSEPDWLKLKFIADHTNQSMHALCLDVLIPSINKKIKKLVGDLETKQEEQKLNSS